jgi:predicted metal-dependent phosphoesterase TrpH
MPARQPFTALCQAAARPSTTDRADLHIHTVHSDGLYTPAQVIDLANRAGLLAIAITDHDTLAGVGEAQNAASGTRLEVISGVEISSSYRGREIHLLGYFVDPANTELAEALASLQRGRNSRFETMLARLREEGVQLPEMPPSDSSGRSLGRRSLAELLVQSGKVGSIREAFHRYLGDGGIIAGPKVLLEAAQALALIREAGGVASWAHPSYDFTMDALPELSNWGLAALEAVYPSYKNSKMRDLRDAAAAHGLVVTGGSDCHGPDSAARAVGAVTITCSELELLRARMSR